MTVCKFCGKEMEAARSCIESYFVIDGERYRPIPYIRQTDPETGAIQMRCPDCNVLSGGFHHIGCSLEICPKCRGQWIYCRCFGRRFKRDDFLKCKIIPFPQGAVRRKS